MVKTRQTPKRRSKRPARQVASAGKKVKGWAGRKNTGADSRDTVGWHVAIFNLRVYIFRVCRIFVENCLSVSRQKCAFIEGDDAKSPQNKARRHGVPEFTVIDMGVSLAIGPIRLS